MKNVNAAKLLVNGICVAAHIAEFGFAIIGAATMSVVICSLRNGNKININIDRKKDEE